MSSVDWTLLMSINGRSALPTDWLFRWVVAWMTIIFGLGLGYFTVEWVSFGQGYLEPIVTAAWGAVASGMLGLLGWMSHRLSDPSNGRSDVSH